MCGRVTHGLWPGTLLLPLCVLELGAFLCETAALDLGVHGNIDCILEKSQIEMLGKLLKELLILKGTMRGENEEAFKKEAVLVLREESGPH